MMDGALLIVAGLFLLLPGFLTDAVGFMLLIPLVRQLIIRRYVRVIPAHHRGSPESNPTASRMIEGEYRREDP